MVKKGARLLAYRRTIALIAVAVVLFIAFLIIRPFLVAIISAMVLAYLFYPIYKWMVNHLPAFLPREALSSLTTCLIIILFIVIPLGAITAVLTTELRNGYIYLQEAVNLPGFGFGLPSLAGEKALPYPGIPSLKIPFFEGREIGINLANFKEPVLNLAGQVITWIQGILLKIPNMMFTLFITIFSVYFFLKSAHQINIFMRNVFPLPHGKYNQIFRRFDDLSRGMINGQIVVGAIQGFLAWTGFIILGVPNPVLWAVLTAVISIIPLLGAALVWFPIAVYLIVAGLVVGTYWKGIALLVYGFLVISTIDNVLKPKIVGERARVHPLVIFFGILGGIQLIGIPGILIGPLVLTLLDVVMEIFREVI
jgi:predicted PurR-regulated permease PerM